MLLSTLLLSSLLPLAFTLPLLFFLLLDTLENLGPEVLLEGGSEIDSLIWVDS